MTTARARIPTAPIRYGPVMLPKQRYNVDGSGGRRYAPTLSTRSIRSPVTTPDPSTAAAHRITRSAPVELASRCSTRSSVQRTGVPECFDANAISTTYG